jgi:hypothetical protein
MSIESTPGANANGASKNGVSERGGDTNDGSVARTVGRTIPLPERIMVTLIARDRKVIPMRNLLVKTLLGSGILLLSGFVLNGQNYPSYPPYSGDPYYRGPAYNNEPYAGSWGIGLWDGVRADLDRAAFDAYGSRRRIDHARKEVNDVERQLSRGHFDKGEMDEAISAVQHVVDNDNIPQVDRSVLWQDLGRMRDFRALGKRRYGESGYYP